MKALARAPSTMPRSGIREVMELASRIPDVIHLEVGEPHVNTPDYIIDAAAEAARAGFTKYSPNSGLPSLRQAIVRKVSTVNRITASAEQIVVTPGAVFAVAASLFAIVDPGEEVLVPDPGWPNYISILHLIGATAVRYPLGRREGFQPDFNQLSALVTRKTKAVLINTPGNPTGAVFSPETMRVLVKFAMAHDLYVISDEVYEHFVFEGEHASAGAFDQDGRVVTIFGFSKTFAMTGWRLGYAVANSQVAAVMAKLAEPFVSCPSTISQKAGEAALKGSQGGIDGLRSLYRSNRDVAVAILHPAGLLASIPRGAFYALVDLSDVDQDSLALSRRLLEEEHVATAPGNTFGETCAGLVRISYATTPSLVEEGCTRIVRFARKHGGRRASL